MILTKYAEENIIFPCIFKEQSSFIFRLKNKIIFSAKKPILRDNKKKYEIAEQLF